MSSQLKKSHIVYAFSIDGYLFNLVTKSLILVWVSILTRLDGYEMSLEGA